MRILRLKNPLTIFPNCILDHFLCRLFKVVGPSDLSELVNPESRHIKVIAQLGRLVVPRENMMVVVPSLAHRHNRNTQRLHWFDSPEIFRLYPLISECFIILLLSYVSYGLLPHIWATLFTNHVKFRFIT